MQAQHSTQAFILWRSKLLSLMRNFKYTDHTTSKTAKFLLKGQPQSDLYGHQYRHTMHTNTVHMTDHIQVMPMLYYFRQ